MRATPSLRSPAEGHLDQPRRCPDANPFSKTSWNSRRGSVLRVPPREHREFRRSSSARPRAPGTPISIACSNLGERVSVAVSDGGIGIDPADHERIFERFGRAVSARHFGGLGLGLWMARAIVKAMGGSIMVRSALGQGATFTVELSCHATRG